MGTKTGAALHGAVFSGMLNSVNTECRFADEKGESVHGRTLARERIQNAKLMIFASSKYSAVHSFA
jgi:hypothetical protein